MKTYTPLQSFKPILVLILFLLTLGVGEAFGETETLFSMTGSSGYTIPTGWSQTNVTTGDYLGFTKDGSILTSPLYTPHDNVSLSYSVATFGAGTNHSLAIRVLNESGLVKKTYYTATPTSTTYITTGSPIDLGDIDYDFKIQFYLAATDKGVRLRNITLTGDPTCTSLTMSEVSVEPRNTQLVLSWPEVAHASSYTVTCKNKSTGDATGTIGEVSGSTTKTCTITDLTNGTAYTWSVKPVGTGSYCSSNISQTGDATPNIVHTVTWYNNGSEHTTTNVTNGSKPTFPSNPTSCDGTSTTFYGWSTAEWSGPIDNLAGKTVYTSASAMPAISEAISYFAVFAKKDVGSEVNVTGGVFSDDIAYGWTKSGTGTYTGNGVKFDNVNDNIQSNDISSHGYTTVTVKFKAGHNGGSGSVLTFTSLNGSGTVIDTKTFIPTEAYTSQKTINSITLSGSTTIKYVKVTMTSKTNNLGMKYCEIFHTPISYSKYLTNCCTELDQINGSFLLARRTLC